MSYVFFWRIYSVISVHISNFNFWHFYYLTWELTYYLNYIWSWNCLKKFSTVLTMGVSIMCGWLRWKINFSYDSEDWQICYLFYILKDTQRSVKCSKIKLKLFFIEATQPFIKLLLLKFKYLDYITSNIVYWTKIKLI